MEEESKTNTANALKGEYTEKIKIVHSSIKEHLNPNYRKQYNIRRFIACVLVFLFLRCSLQIAQVLLIQQAYSH